MATKPLTPEQRAEHEAVRLEAELAALYTRTGLGLASLERPETSRYRLTLETHLGDDVTIEGSYTALTVVASRILLRGR